MKTVAATQARLGSTRLPKKALLPLNGLELIDHLVKQIKACSAVDEICLSTSDQPLDQTLIKHFADQGRPSFGGPVDDIVARLHGVCEATGADILVRAWGDCPFVCPDIITHMLDKFKKNGLSFLSNSELTNRSFPPGLDIEIYSASLLRHMNGLQVEPALREFPIECIKQMGDDVSRDYFHLSEMPGTDSLPTDLHMTIDYPQDFAAAENILKKMTPDNHAFDFAELCRFYKTNSEDFRRFSTEARNIEYQAFLKQQSNEVKK